VSNAPGELGSGRAYLCGSILTGNPLEEEMCDVSGEHELIRKETATHVWAQFEVADTTGDVLVVWVVQMTV
jgi:hypothetical protein